MRKASLVVSCFVVLLILGAVPVIAETETETESQSGYQTGQTTHSYQTNQTSQRQGSALYFSIVPVSVPSHPNYTGGSGHASIYATGTTLSIHFHIDGAASRAQFALLLSVNNSTQTVANMTADWEGEVEAEAQASLPAGNYSLGIQVLDTSSFGTPTLVMTSAPASEQLQLPAQSQTMTQTQSETEGQQVNTLGGTESDDGEVRNAISSLVIPAVLDVGTSGSSANVVDSRFSISIGYLQNNGILVSVSAVNVTGPRVILVNLTAPAAQKLFSGSVLITLDNATIRQASSVSQVLGAGPGDPAMWVIYTSSPGLKLLISIPHFSFHVIEILPLLAEIGSAILAFPAVILAVAGATSIIVVVYTRRTRFIG